MSITAKYIKNRIPYSSTCEVRREVRRAVVVRDQKCQYCQKPLDVFDASMDHLTPESLGGDTSTDNCVCACRHCNISKGSDLPLEFFARKAGFPIPQDFRSKMRPGESVLETIARQPRNIRKALTDLGTIAVQVDNGIKDVRLNGGFSHYVNIGTFKTMLALGFVELESEVNLGGTKRHRIYRITEKGKASR